LPKYQRPANWAIFTSEWRGTMTRTSTRRSAALTIAERADSSGMK
jgi:hypothetical protein